MPFSIAEIRVGRARPFGPKGVPSAIDKLAVTGPVMARAEGLEGDEQGDRRSHGGPDKAVHAYPAAHYARWRKELPDRAGRLRPGGFGENLVVDGATEADICLGDRFRVGAVLLEVSQGRQPCWKLNLRFDRPDMARRVQASGRTGWYFRVIEPGVLRAGDPVGLEARPNPDWPLVRVADLLYRDRLNLDALRAFAAIPSLTPGWRRLAEARLARGRTEDWSARIDTPG